MIMADEIEKAPIQWLPVIRELFAGTLAIHRRGIVPVADFPRPNDAAWLE
jgi:hypothetical protein